MRTAVWWSVLALASACTDDDPYAEWLVDGCWDRGWSDVSYTTGGDEPWELFTCSLPTVCDPIDVETGSYGGVPMISDEVNASALCMLDVLRDGTSAAHSIRWSSELGVTVHNLHYYVLPDGVVGSDEYWDDLGLGAHETFRRPRADAWFDECLAQHEALDCLLELTYVPASLGPFPPLDQEACIDAAPRCPE